MVDDRAYDSDATRLGLLDEGVAPQVPNHPRRVDPWPLYRPSYRERPRVERPVGRLEQFRRVATRYEKLAATFLGLVHPALAVIRLAEFVNTT